MAEGILVLAGQTALEARLETLGLDELPQILVEPRRGLAAEEREQAAAPRALPEHAGRAQQPSRLCAQAEQARLHHRQHALRRPVALALSDGADELLEVERIA